MARAIIAGFSAEMPTLAAVWQSIDTALADTLALAAEISLLRADLAEARLHRANLAAAALAVLAAHHEGESDPLAYLRDELRAQHYGTDWGRG
jgi:hypothetical protein